MTKTYTITITGPGGMERYTGVLNYEFKGLPGSTYLVLTFVKGVQLHLNDFGVRQVLVEPTGVDSTVIIT